MRVYYFNGNKVKGIDLTSDLEDISISHQTANNGMTVLEMRASGKYVIPNQKAIEGEHEDRLYYLHNYIIKWCKKRSLKALLIKLVGVDIDCPNRR